VTHGIIPLEEEIHPCSKPEETGKETMNTAQVLVELLKEYGVEYCLATAFEPRLPVIFPKEGVIHIQ
jgi:hypothetical protein